MHGKATHNKISKQKVMTLSNMMATNGMLFLIVVLNKVYTMFLTIQQEFNIDGLDLLGLSPMKVNT